MKTGGLALVSAFSFLGCGKNNEASKRDEPAQTAAVEPDNSARNVRDADGTTKTPGINQEVNDFNDHPERSAGGDNPPLYLNVRATSRSSRWMAR